VLGRTETVSTFSEADLRAHHAHHYSPGHMVLGLVGAVSPSEGCALAGRFFGDGSGPARPLPDALVETAGGGRGPSTKLVPDADNQFHLQLSFPAPGYRGGEDIPLALLARLLDDGPTTLLQRRIREELGLAYHVGAEYTGYQDVGHFDVATSVKAERLPELLEALVDCLLEFRERGPGQDDLARAKHRYRLDLEFNRDSLEAQIERYAWPLLYSQPREVEEELRRVEALAPEDIHGRAVELFERSRLHLVLVGPLGREAESAVERALARW
jgi:predicted Zn-dependent peptidase